MKTDKRKITIIICISLLVIVTLYILSVFFGTPWGYSAAESRYEEVVPEEYVITEVYYSHEDKCYKAKVIHVGSESKFDVYFDDEKDSLAFYYSENGELAYKLGLFLE